MSRNLIIKKRVGLGRYSDGWDDCYLVFTAMTKADRDALQDRASKDGSNEDAESYIDEYLTEHFLHGKIRVTDDEGKESLSSAETDDLPNLPLDTKTSIFSEITTGGGKYSDPKA